MATQVYNISNKVGGTVSLVDSFGNPYTFSTSGTVSLTDGQYQDAVSIFGVANVVISTSNAGQRVSIVDATSGLSALVTAFHNTDNQNLGTVNGLMTGGVAQLLNPIGYLDRQRSTGIDNTPATGIPAGAGSTAMAFKTAIASAITAVPSGNTVTPTVMSGTVGGVPWSIQVGSFLSIDSGASQEYVNVTAVTATTFTAVFAKNHGTNTVVSGFTFNQSRDASGENDGATGAGTSVAAGYEFNGGDPSGGNYDRERSLNAKGLKTQTISAGGGAASTSLTLAANTGLQPGMKVLLYKASTFPTAGSFESVNISLTYVAGTNTVPLASAIINAVTYDTIAYDTFAALGPQLNGFLPFGIGVETDAVFDPITGLSFQERMAPGNPGVLAVSSDTAKATYRYCAQGFTLAVTSPTDVVVMQGSATKTIRIKRIKVSGQATAQGSMPIQLVRRSTAGTLGSAVLTGITVGKHDINDAAPTAVVSTVGTANYTTLGNSAGVIGADRLGMSTLTTGTAGNGQDVVWDFSTRMDKAIILRGVSDFLNINFTGAAVPAGGVVDFEIETEEDNS